MSTLKIAATVWMAAAAGIACAGEIGSARQHNLTVCIDPGAHRLEILSAKGLASKLFASIGVKVDWHERTACPEDRNALQVSLSDKAPANLPPGALAYALPYEGSHIVVFYDRVREAEPKQVTCLLAYVLVHEVTHILEGIVRHSESGIMKAYWSREDRFEIGLGRLSFAPEDVALIIKGLDARESGTTLAARTRPDSNTSASALVAVR